MINLTCAACTEKTPVESLLAAAEKICTHCGMTVIGGQDPARRHETDWSSGTYRSSGSGSGAVRVVAIVTLLYGVLDICGGLCLGWLTSLLNDPQTLMTLRQSGLSSEELAQVYSLTRYTGIVVGLLIMLGVVCLIAGYGLLRRDSFSRYLTLGLGSLSGFFALLGLVQLEICSGIVNGVYAVLVFAVLLNPGKEKWQ
jgi:hypothetical protein